MNLTDGFDLIDPASYAAHGPPHESWTALRRRSPVHRCEPRDYPPFWAITRHAHICEISKQPDRFLSQPGITHQRTHETIDRSEGIGAMRTIIEMDPPEHRAFRKVASPWFTPRALDRIDAGVLEHLQRTLGRVNVAVGHHGNRQRRLDRGHRLVLGVAAVAHLARAAVHGEHRHAGRGGGARQRQRVAPAGDRRAPAGAHLQRHRHAARRARSHHRLDDGDGQRLVAHQRRARPLAAHLLGRTAHVDVDDLGAAVDVVARGVGHLGGLDAGDLHRDRPRLAGVVGAARSLQRRPQLALAGHHLAHRVPGAEPAAQPAKRPIGHASHRRDEERVGQHDGTHAQRHDLRRE